jgi:hypothetical protein
MRGMTRLQFLRTRAAFAQVAGPDPQRDSQFRLVLQATAATKPEIVQIEPTL